jgi:putative ATP-dependent endonuclease of OLD family
MYISAIRATGYRNLAGAVPLSTPLAILVGENNAGKSNVIDAIRTVLEPDAGPHARHWLREDDFTHDGTGERLTNTLELEVLLTDLSDDESARMVTCLTPGTGPGTARLRLKASLGADGRVNTRWFGGDAEHPDVERHARDALRFVYLHPLRDAVADLRPGRDNRLVPLLDALAPDGHPDRAAIVSAAAAANEALHRIPAVQQARSHIADRLDSMTGGGRFAQQSSLAFDDPRFERVVASLRAKIGQFAALEMQENGLGFNNLLYMAVLLAALSDAPPDQALRVLLVEEPEAHLHPQLQDLLMQFLEIEAGARTQVIVSTHSPNFASSARVERVTVMARADSASLPEARLPRDFGLEDKQLRFLRRFLDVTKSALLFARGVILVEGIAEQLLIPVLAQRMNRPLAPNGVAVVNVAGVAFPPFTDLFGPGKLPYRVAVVSDSDSPSARADLEGSEPNLSPRAADLAGRAGENVLVVLAARTLEWDLAVADNTDVMLDALGAVKPRVAAQAERAIRDDGADAADTLLAAVRDVKGRFAQELADRLADESVPFTIPGYLAQAIEWVTDEPDAGATSPES